MSPQALTWSVWVPVEESMDLIYGLAFDNGRIGAANRTNSPWSETLCEEQVDADAESVKGEETPELFAGSFTVTPAKAGMEAVTIAQAAIRILEAVFMGRVLCG